MPELKNQGGQISQNDIATELALSKLGKYFDEINCELDDNCLYLNKYPLQVLR